MSVYNTRCLSEYCIFALNQREVLWVGLWTSRKEYNQSKI